MSSNAKAKFRGQNKIGGVSIKSRFLTKKKIQERLKVIKATRSEIGPMRRLMQRSFLPAPGEGPSAAEREAGFFDIRFIGLKNGQRIDARVTGDRDPGYGATSLMLAECALSLAENQVRDGLEGGSWTPASSFGSALVGRLEAHAGMRFSVAD